MDIQTSFVFKHSETRHNWKVSHITGTHITLEELEAGGKLVKSETGDLHVIPAKEKTVTLETFKANVKSGRLIANEHINNAVAGFKIQSKKKINSK